jgi:hypothetical protein
MAQAGFTPISLYHTTTPAAVPTAGNLVPGELGLNIADMKLYAENSSGVVTLLADAAAQGTVTSVGGTGTVNGITLTGTVTSSGNLTLGGTLSGVSLSTQVTGTLPVANGGTGQTTFTDGQLLIGNSTGNTLAKSTLTAGSGITITNGAGTITIAASGGGTVTQVSTGTGLTGGPITTTGTISVATNGITNALLRQSSGLSLIGRSASTTGDVADITAASDHNVLRRSGTTIGFGAINLAQSGAVTGTLAVSNGGTGVTSSTGTTAVVLSTNPTLIGTKETRVALGSGSGTRTIDLNTGNYFTNTVTGTSTFATSNVPSSGTTACFILDLTNGGSATVNWMTNTRWAGGTPPTLTAAGRDVLAFFTFDAGSNWNGFVLGKDVK